MTVADGLWELPEDLVFHYTSQEGLLGIVKSRTIWATDVRYLSDAAELNYPVCLARDELAEMSKSAVAEEAALWTLIDEGLSDIVKRDYIGVYVCSFSSHKDLLSQWRGYCPEGSGFSIGFDLSKLQEVLQEQGFRSVKCVYEKGRQVEIIREFLVNQLGFIREFVGNSSDAQRRGYGTAVTGVRFAQIAPVIKDPSFSEEQEWRLISATVRIDDPRVKFREGKSVIVPYYELRLVRDGEPMAVPEIMIGPTPHDSLAVNSVRNFLWHEKVRCDSVNLSEIPYRTW